MDGWDAGLVSEADEYHSSREMNVGWMMIIS